MRIRLEFRAGKIIPSLELSEEEDQFFRENRIMRGITYRQIMLGLGESNLRYPSVDVECSEYYPVREITEERLKTCASFILEDLKAKIRSVSNAPQIMEAVSEFPVLDQERTIEALQESGILEPVIDQPIPARLIVGDKVFRLEPVGREDSLIDDLRREFVNWRNALSNSYSSQLQNLRNEFRRILERIRREFGQNWRLPHLPIERLIRYEIMFFSDWNGNLAYGFQLPFTLRQTKIKISDQVYRLKERYQIIVDGYLTLIFRSNGSNWASFLTEDRHRQQPFKFAHSLRTSGSFCSGSYSIPILNLDRDIISQIVRIRDTLQSIFETVNPESFGTFLNDEMHELRHYYLEGEYDRIVEEELGETVWRV